MLFSIRLFVKGYTKMQANIRLMEIHIFIGINETDKSPAR